MIRNHMRLKACVGNDRLSSVPCHDRGVLFLPLGDMLTVFVEDSGGHFVNDGVHFGAEIYKVTSLVGGMVLYSDGS